MCEFESSRFIKVVALIRGVLCVWILATLDTTRKNTTYRCV